LTYVETTSYFQLLTKRTARWSNSLAQSKGFKPGVALAKWLNDPDVGYVFFEGLMADARLVFHWLSKYESLHDLVVAHRKKKVPDEFWDSLQRLNDALETFIYVPQVNLDEFYDGHRLSRALVPTESPIALVAVQVQWLLQLVEEDAIEKIRRCEQCNKWYFAYFSDQRFCTDACRGENFAQSEPRKAYRRKYMREYYHIKKYKNVK
jgi:hypothetical protein